MVDEGVPPDKLELKTKNAIFQGHESEKTFMTTKGIMSPVEYFFEMPTQLNQYFLYMRK